MSERTSDIILVAICAVVLAIVAYPLYYVLVASFSDPYEVYAGKTFLLPSGFTLDGYKAVFAEKNIVAGFLNSVKYTVIGTVFSVLLIAKCQQGYVGVSTWWYIEELMGDYAKDCVFLPALTGPKGVFFTGMEMETIDWHKTDFEQAVKEQEGLWLRDGGPTDEEWAEYKEYLSKKCGMDDLIQVYQDAYDRYSAAE